MPSPTPIMWWRALAPRPAAQRGRQHKPAPDPVPHRWPLHRTWPVPISKWMAHSWAVRQQLLLSPRARIRSLFEVETACGSVICKSALEAPSVSTHNLKPSKWQSPASCDNHNRFASLQSPARNRGAGLLSCLTLAIVLRLPGASDNNSSVCLNRILE